MKSSPEEQRGGDGAAETADSKAEMPAREVKATAEKSWRREMWIRSAELVAAVGSTTTVGHQSGVQPRPRRRRESRAA